MRPEGLLRSLPPRPHRCRSAAAALVAADSRPWPEVAADARRDHAQAPARRSCALGLSPRERLPVRRPAPFAGSRRPVGSCVRRATFRPRTSRRRRSACLASFPPIRRPSCFREATAITENEQAAGIARLLDYVALNVPWIEELAPDDLEGLLLGALRWE